MSADHADGRCGLMSETLPGDALILSEPNNPSKELTFSIDHCSCGGKALSKCGNPKVAATEAQTSQAGPRLACVFPGNGQSRRKPPPLRAAPRLGVSSVPMFTWVFPRYGGTEDAQEVQKWLCIDAEQTLFGFSTQHGMSSSFEEKSIAGERPWTVDAKHVGPGAPVCRAARVGGICTGPPRWDVRAQKTGGRELPFRSIAAAERNEMEGNRGKKRVREENKFPTTGHRAEMFGVRSDDTGYI
ncbi:hypothetical protein Bbelb_346270 [Branchiostoma belcheri]|nr:hypothetical protein Bbelb_346270 [Branchiostoma belcheri]